MPILLLEVEIPSKTNAVHLFVVQKVDTWGASRLWEQSGIRRLMVVHVYVIDNRVFELFFKIVAAV